MVRSRVIALFMLVLLMGQSLYAQEKQSIAVIEFEAKGVSQLEASTLTDRFRSELVRTEKFVQIERSKIEQIFKEQKFQLSGSVSDEKLVEIGALLGAELIVIGSIGKIGSTYTIDLRLVDVQSGQIVGSYFRDHRGEIDGLLPKFTTIAAEIAGTGGEAVTLDNREIPAPTVTQPTPAPEVPITDPNMVRFKASSDAEEDFMSRKWVLQGGTAGCTGGFLLGIPGGLLGIIGTYIAIQMSDVDLPETRLTQVMVYDDLNRQRYIDEYEKATKKLRRKAGTQASSGGCCVGILLAATLITAAAGS